MEKHSFLFDTNKCVGCMACVAGCIIENGTNISVNWREVNCYNKLKHPDLPVFYFSLACNHCEDAPCMKNCPALAYTRDAKTGAVVHHAEACIGCTYCTWACPYDAPKLNPSTHIIEKCNFCVDRITEGLKPACVLACPVGALDFGQNLITENDYLTPGFVNVGIKPSIRLIPLRLENTTPRIENLDALEIDKSELKSLLPKQISKISLKKEWTLVLFTLVVGGLVSWFTAGMTHKITVSPIVFIALAITAIALTSFHIGKKFRMWRFILNLQHSWLSREIVSFSAFISLGVLFLITDLQWLGYLAVFFGAVSLVSVDMVYRLLQRKEKNKFHSAMILITAILFWSWFSGILYFIALTTLVKTDLYIRRKYNYYKHGGSVLPILSAIRLISLLVPVVLMIAHVDVPLWIVVVILLIGEIIDRSEFYHEAEVITPGSELDKHLLNHE